MQTQKSGFRIMLPLQIAKQVVLNNWLMYITYYSINKLLHNRIPLSISATHVYVHLPIELETKPALHKCKCIDIFSTLHARKFFMIFCCLQIFSKTNGFKMWNTIKALNSLDPGQAWHFVRPDILSGLIWVQTVCKSYQPKTLAGKEFNICAYPLQEKRR